MSDDMRQELNGLKLEVKNLAVKIGGLEGRLDGVEGRLGGVEGRLGGLEGRVGGLENRVGGLEDVTRRLAISVAQLNENYSVVSARLDNMPTRSELASHMDRIVGLLEDSRLRWSVPADVLAQHDKRLTKLERRRRSS